MGLFTSFQILFVALTGMAVYKCYRDLTASLPVPAFDMEQYWGPGDRSQYREDPSIKPFRVSYGADVIGNLRRKLNDLPPLTPPLENVNFEYGFNSDHLKKVLQYWRSDYLDKWGEREKFLNQFPQYKTQIQGLNIHYIHVKPKVDAGTKVLPLLLLHGWPGSVREFYDIIPMLTAKSQDKDFVFEVIVPSLPGYGWSEGSPKTGFGAMKMAVIMKNLMARIGHRKFYIQGGDWGSLVGNVMAKFFPDDVTGLHLNSCAGPSTLAMIKTAIASFAPTYFVEEKYVDFYFPHLPTLKDVMFVEMGYAHIQATKPDTIGSALVGNPVGLAAYILEKFSTWTNREYRTLADGGLTKYFTLDSLLDNVMIYYLTDSITTSQRLYAEAMSFNELFAGVIDRVPTKVPTACAKFRYELFQHIDWVLRDSYWNLVQSNHYDDGGHFAAMQLPKVLYGDLVEFVKKVEGK